MVTEYSKPTFKVTEIGLLPKEWSISSLSTSCLLITDGSHYSPLEFENGTKLIATVYNMGENKIDVDSCKRISDKDYEMLVRNGCKPVEGDVLFSKDGTVGICFPFNQKSDLVLLSSVAILRPKKILDPTFVSQYMKSDFGKKQVIGLKTGTALSRITLEKLKHIKLPIPSLPEQQKIAKILSDTDSLIESLDKLITKKKNIKQGLMQTLLTRGIGHTKFKKTEIGEIPEEWKVKFLGDQKIAKVVMGQSPPSSFYNTRNEGLPFLQGNADFGELYPRTSIYCSKPLKTASKGDVLLSVRAPVGELNVSNFKCIIGRGLAAIRGTNIGTNGSYIYYYIKNNISRLRALSAGSTFEAVGKDTLVNFEIALPPLPEQQKIAKILSDADKEIEVLEQKRDKYKMLKTGMMQQLLTGGIRVK